MYFEYNDRSVQCIFNKPRPSFCGIKKNSQVIVQRSDTYSLNNGRSTFNCYNTQNDNDDDGTIEY